MGKWTVIQLICLICICLPAIAQQPLNKDSLLDKLRLAKEDEEKVRMYYILTASYQKEDLQAAEKYCRLGLELSRKLNYRQGFLDYYVYYTNILNYQGKFDSVLNLNLEAVEYARKNSDSAEVGRTMLNVGMAYRQLEDYENAVSYIEGGRAILWRKGVSQYDGLTSDLLQVLYYSMHQYRKAVNIGLYAVSIIEKNGKVEQLPQAYNNLGLNYIQLHLYDSAKYYLDKGKRLAEQFKETAILISADLNFALIALKQKQIDSIKPNIDRALALSRKYEAYEYLGLAQYGLAYHYLLKKDYLRSRLNADSAMALANQYNMRYLKQMLYALLSSLSYATQDSKLGYLYFNEYELLNDSVLNESIANSTIHIEKKYETEKKETQLQLQETKLRQKSILNYFLTAGGILLLIISLLSYRNYKNRQKLQQTRIDELENEKQLTATEAVLKGEDQERTRLAKDLHDGLGGMLSGIKHSLNQMKGNLIMTPENGRAFERSIDMLDSSIKEMRRVAHNMMPEILVRYGLDVALKEFCSEIERSGMIHANYQSIGMDGVPLEHTTAVTIYRIVQELVNNSIKHAAATNVLVQVHFSEPEQLMAITVEDDGKGFDRSILDHSTGMGWNNIRNRVEFLKGKLDLGSDPGNGTSVLIEINI